MRIGDLGTGTIASAVMHGITADGHESVVSECSAAQAAVLDEALNTPRGYNQRLRLHMEVSGMGATLGAGLDALE